MFATSTVHNQKDLKIVCWTIEKLKRTYKNITNWRYNRSPDKERILQIQQYMTTSGNELVPGLVCAWEPQPGCLEIYDGFHRFSACKDLNIKILVKITKTQDEEVIKSDFESVNKSVYVPAVYLDTNGLKNKVCDEVYELMICKFPKNVTYSNSPQQQNFSKNSIVEIVHELDVDFSKLDIAEEIFKEFLKINQIVKELKLKPKYRKTISTDFWLMFWSHQMIIETVNLRLYV